jgi:hypothetical protein
MSGPRAGAADDREAGSWLSVMRRKSRIGGVGESILPKRRSHGTNAAEKLFRQHRPDEPVCLAGSSEKLF